MNLKNIDIAVIIRYVLSGFNTIILLFVLPLLYINSSFIKFLLSQSSALTILLLSVAIGYLIDILKLYQLVPKYRSLKNKFMSEISELLSIPESDVSSYFTISINLSKKQDTMDLVRRQSEWILISNTAIMFFLSTIIWILIFTYNLIKLGITSSLIIPILIVLISVICSLRLFKIGTRERIKSKNECLIFIKSNENKIKNAWKLEVDLKDSK